jgi:AcrR family transcriptional regulator
MTQENLKKHVLNESSDLFMRYGIRSVTMDDIAQHLAVSKKTLYQLFNDKEEIIMLVMKQHFQMHMEEMESIRKSCDNAIEEVHKISLYAREQIKSVNPGVMFDLQKYYKEVWNVYLAFNRDIFFKSLLESIKWGVHDGYFRSDIHPEILAILRIEEINMSFDNHIFPEDKYSLSDTHNQLYDHFVYGILTSKGLKLWNQYKQNNQ